MADSTSMQRNPTLFESQGLGQREDILPFGLLANDRTKARSSQPNLHLPRDNFARRASFATKHPATGDKTP